MRGITDPRLADLMERISHQDEPALGELFKITLPQVHSVARAILRSPDDAKGVVVDVFHFVWGNAHRFEKSRGSVMAWLTTISRRRAIDCLRRRACAVSLDSKSSRALFESLVADTLEPSQSLSLFQEGSAVHAALMTLPPMRRKLILLAFFNGYTHAEIALITKLSLGTVKSHVRRALLTMRKTIELHSERDVAMDSSPCATVPYSRVA